MVSSSNGVINNKVGSSVSGVTNTFTVTNPSNTASSAARETITVGGGTAADPTLNFNVSGVTDWEMGIDNSVSDNLTISQGTALGTNDVWRMTTAGQRTLPLQCAFDVYLSASVLNVTGDGTGYTILFDTKRQDVGNNYNPATGLFTAPVTGTYLLVATADLDGITAGMTTSAIGIGLSSGVSYQGNGYNPSGTFNTLAINVQACARMTAGTTAGISVAFSGGAKVVDVLGSAGSITHFSGFLLG